MLSERTYTTALNKFWAHVETCDECSPEGACPECKNLLEAVTAEARASADATAKFYFATATVADDAGSIRAASDQELIRALEECCGSPGTNDTRREAIFEEINRRVRSLRFD